MPSLSIIDRGPLPKRLNRSRRSYQNKFGRELIWEVGVESVIILKMYWPSLLKLTMIISVFIDLFQFGWGILFILILTGAVVGLEYAPAGTVGFALDAASTLLWLEITVTLIIIFRFSYFIHALQRPYTAYRNKFVGIMRLATSIVFICYWSWMVSLGSLFEVGSMVAEFVMTGLVMFFTIRVHQKRQGTSFMIRKDNSLLPQPDTNYVPLEGERTAM